MSSGKNAIKKAKSRKEIDFEYYTAELKIDNKKSEFLIQKYSIYIYSEIGDCLNVEYLDSNVTLEQGASNHTNCITTQVEFEVAFSSFSEEIDFGEDMLVVYFYSNYHCTTNEETGELCFSDIMKEVRKDGDRLNISFYRIPEATQIIGELPIIDVIIPIQGCVVFKISKIEVNTIETQMCYKYKYVIN